MISQSIAQLVRDMSHAIPYAGEYDHVQKVKSLARDMGYAFAGFPESEVTEHWDGLYVALVGKNDALRDIFYSELRDAWVESWMRRTHDVFKDKDRVVLMPTWANPAAKAKWMHRESLDDVIATMQKDKVPYLTMKRCAHEVLREKYGKQ